MTDAIRSVWLGQVALASRDLVIHGGQDSAPPVSEALRATLMGAVCGALMTMTREETYNVTQRIADELAGSICDARREKMERRK